jgi:hypothetical protein
MVNNVLQEYSRIYCSVDPVNYEDKLVDLSEQDVSIMFIIA